MKVKSFSHVRLFATLWTVACQAPLSMEFSRQKYWIGLPFPSPRDLPDPGIEPRSPALQADSLPSQPPGKLKKTGKTQISDSSSDPSNCLRHLAFLFPLTYTDTTWKGVLPAFHKTALANQKGQGGVSSNVVVFVFHCYYYAPSDFLQLHFSLTESGSYHQWLHFSPNTY